MTYKILKTTVNGETINTEVEYNFDGTIVTVDIPHFMPKGQSDIETAILNRAVSEKRKLDAEELNKRIVSNLTIGEDKPIS